MKTQCRFAVLAIALVVAGCSTAPKQGDAVNTVAMHCGALSITTRLVGKKLLLTALGEEIVMKPVVAASGARYQHPEDESTTFWNKGNTALLSLRGQEVPECVTAGTVMEPFMARGSEPFWAITLDNGQFTLERPDVPVNLSAPYRQTADGADTLIEVQAQEHPLALRISQTLCHDRMSGMSYPYKAEFTLEGEELRGCGGEPDSLLQGVEWRVSALGRSPVAENSEVSISFLDGGRVAGSGSCNRYTGHYRLGGEGIVIEKLASTRKACAPELMAQENVFLTGLAGVDRFDFDKQGQLVLFSAGKMFAAGRMTSY